SSSGAIVSGSEPRSRGFLDLICRPVIDGASAVMVRSGSPEVLSSFLVHGPDRLADEGGRIALVTRRRSLRPLRRGITAGTRPAYRPPGNTPDSPRQVARLSREFATRAPAPTMQRLQKPR